MNDSNLDGIEISLANKMMATTKLVGELPAGTKSVGTEKKPMRTLSKEEKEKVAVPDGSTVLIISKYSDETKKGLELVGPKTIKTLIETINKVRR